MNYIRSVLFVVLLLLVFFYKNNSTKGYRERVREREGGSEHLTVIEIETKNENDRKLFFSVRTLNYIYSGVYLI